MYVIHLFPVYDKNNKNISIVRLRSGGVQNLEQFHLQSVGSCREVFIAAIQAAYFFRTWHHTSILC